MSNAPEYYLVGGYVLANTWKYNYNQTTKHNSLNFSINNVDGGITPLD
jgi:hypothetical protein